MTEKVVNKKYNMVIYSDGSCKPNPGAIGYGFHGYSYLDDEPKKSFGNKDYRITSIGYVEKTDKASAVPNVTPIEVFDGIGSSQKIGSNNAAEILAAKAALKLAAEKPVQKLLLKTDSEYIRKGYTQWLPKWAENNWINREGKYIANHEIWQEMWDIKNKLDTKGVEVNVEWVKGHVGLPGNEKADKLACIGRHSSGASNEGVQLHTHDAESYWNRNISQEKHPLICKPWMYFKTDKSTHITGEYYLGNVGKDEQFLGRKDSDGGYAILKLKEPDKCFEFIRELQSDKAGDENAIIVTNLRSLYSEERAADLLEYGAGTLVQLSPRRLDLYFIDSIGKQNSLDGSLQIEAEPLTREQRPQKLSARVFDCLALMKEKLQDYQSGNQRHNQYYDITDEFYKIENKVVKKEHVTQYKLKPEFKVGSTHHDVTINFEGIDKTIRVDFFIDCPDRNALKRIETIKPKIVLIVWRESDISLRYGVIIETQDSLSIWAGFYSNLIFLQPKDSKQ